MTIAAHNINLVTTCMLSLSSFLIIAAIVITSFLARKEVAINNPEIKVYNPKEYNFRIINPANISHSQRTALQLSSCDLYWLLPKRNLLIIIPSN